jgi:hypothetical protein
MDIDYEGEGNDFLHTSLDSSIKWIPYSSADSMPGKVGMLEYDICNEYLVKLPGGLPVNLASELSRIHIDKTVDVDLPGRLIGFENGIDVVLPFFTVEKTYIDVGVSPSFYSDDWNFQAPAFRIPIRSFVIYQPNERWAFVAGLGVYGNYETPIVPIAGFIYSPSKQLTLDITTDGPIITYALNDRVTLFADADYGLNNEYTVTRNNSTNVVLLYRNLSVGGGVKCRVSKFIEGSLSAGGVFDRSLEYRDGAGKVDIEKGFCTKFEIKIKA